MWTSWQLKQTLKVFAPIVGMCFNCSLKNTQKLGFLHKTSMCVR